MNNILLPTLDEGFKVNFLRRLYLDSLNLVQNPYLETLGVGDPDFWANWSETAGDGTLANETTIVFRGTNAAKMTAGATKNTRIQENITVVVGKKYLFLFRTRGDGTYAGRYRVRDESNGADITVGTITTGISETTYTQVGFGFTSPVGCISVSVRLQCSSIESSVCYFDDFELYLLN